MIEPASSQLFAASQIAIALGRSKQFVERLLKAIPASGKLLVRGNLTNAWTPLAFPSLLCQELQAVAVRKGCRSIEHLLTAPTEPWQPKIPIGDVDPKHVTKAAQLRDALASSLARKDDLSISRAEFDQQGVDDYSRCFGYAISTRHWRRLFDRTIERDRGLEQWERLEIYLDDNIGEKPVTATPAPKARFIHAELIDLVASMENKADPTSPDRDFLLDAAYRHWERFCDASPDASQQRAFKKSLLHYLFSAVPSLSKTPKAMRWMFNHKYAIWTQSGKTPEAISDLRQLKSGNFRKPDFSADQEKIRNEAILLGGNESLAHRKLRQSGQLSPEFTDYYAFNPRINKSYLPHSVRDGITREVDMCGPLHRGPWEAKMRGPYIPRDWSDVQPGDWFSGDDVTWNSYFYFYDETGLHVDRGECLVLCDLRTGYLLDYILIAGKYNSRHIRSSILKVHDRHGLPHKGFYFENGVWKARLIRGTSKKNEEFHWRYTERGLCEHGIDMDVRHATTPRAKTIEGLFHILQDTQRREPGFVGFNERTEKMERMQDFLARVRNGKEKPENGLLSMDQWAERLNKIFSEFNSDPQNGKMLKGLAPAEMWREGLNHQPLRQLPVDARYLLSTHRKCVKVHQNGIRLKIGGEPQLFCNEQTGRLIGQDVLAFYNIDYPELLTVSDLNRQNYFTVKRILLPAMSANNEQFSEVHVALSGHRRAAKTIYGSITHPVVSTITRDNQHSEDTKALGQFHNQEVEQAKDAQAETTRKLRKIQTVAASSGIGIVRHRIDKPDVVIEGQQREIEVRERLARKKLSVDEHHE